jgi:hypothetical protein
LKTQEICQQHFFVRWDAAFGTSIFYIEIISIFFQSSIESDLSPLLNSSSLNPMQAAKMTSGLAG